MKTISNFHTVNKDKLSSFAKVQSGAFLQTSPQGEIIYLQMKDLLSASPEKTAATISYTPKLERHYLQKGDLLFAGKGTSYLCQVFDLNIPAIASTTLYTIRLLTHDILPEYLCWYLNHPNIVSLVKSQQVGSGTPLIHKQTLENLEIALPDLATQRRIVELAKLQAREKVLYQAIAEKRQLITNQLIMNKLNK